MREFDALPDVERDLWIADWARQQLECPECRRPRSECSDPARTWYSYRVVCYPTMEAEAALAAYTALHEDAPWHDGSFTQWAADRGPSHPYKFDYGVKIGVALQNVTPWDAFTTKESASPVAPRAEELEGEPTEAAKQHEHSDNDKRTAVAERGE